MNFQPPKIPRKYRRWRNKCYKNDFEPLELGYMKDRERDSVHMYYLWVYKSSQNVEFRFPPYIKAPKYSIHLKIVNKRT